MQLWIGVHLPLLCLEVYRPKWSPDSGDGLAIIERERVVALDQTAREAGIRPGMRRGGVISLAPNTQMFERDAGREHEAVIALATALMQFSPLVTLGEESTVLVDVSASLRLFGGVRAVIRGMKRAGEAIGVTTTISVAPTGEGAWLLARRRGGRALSQQSLLRGLSRLPALMLPPARKYADWLTGIGCQTIGELMRLPRAGLKKRCGASLLDMIDRATGAAPELYEWLELPPTFDARIEMPDRIEHAEACLFAARRLIVQMTGWLVNQQLAIVRFMVQLEHERGRSAMAPTTIDIALGEPTWREEHLVRLLRERLSRVELAAAVIAIRVEARDVRVAAPASDSLFPEPGGLPGDHARLMELLVARLGAENVLRPAPAADHRPEAAARWVPLADAAKWVPPPADTPRPSWLLDEPVKLLMRAHRPFYGTPLRMVSPGERVEAGWFAGELVTRDYFVAESDDFVCYWIYRERVGSRDDEDARWYLHGLFG
ncbi:MULTISPECIES: Y-family DNA polymerase [Paraburkholderia]|uniref:Y-family DNA polymerase n=1 Tax=Paraburkholderia TaxID=1822464 RepID=UPI002257556E|nr:MULTISPECIES: DNA polymerase Y family protein [Paraburkholderia]MCX4175617.1 DNA polymerase Y family protein [Paraburkholderia madseniana]MDQ6463613.1 DNA polymerase Y family protein [Paraburkholderia madseniana]